MLNAIDVYLWGTHVGTAYRRDGHPIVQFEYSEEIRDLEIEVSPIVMPLSGRRYEFVDLPVQSFKGLPGLLADSLPDKFGNKVIRSWLQEQGRNEDEFGALDRLAYTGRRGMGALEYVPALLDKEDRAEKVDVERLAELADEILREREAERAELKQGMQHYAPILRVGSSAGGARAKALIGLNEETGEVRSGQIELPAEYTYWLIKFDGLTGNGDKEGDDKWGYGRVEYSYYLMAKAAGIEMTECRLWNRRHFMTKRFDRWGNGEKWHAQTLGGIAHLDFNNPLVNTYEDAFGVIRQLVDDARAHEQLFRRMVFNVLAWNCDDHVKNISFLMDYDGRWRLSPAYDMCYAYKPTGDWTSRHQMSVRGKRIDIDDEDFVAAAAAGDISRRKARRIVAEVREAVMSWRTFAAEADVCAEFVRTIAARLGCA